MSVLQIRLKNCLQTILEMQPTMRQIYRAKFADDFNQLQDYLVRVDKMDLNEEDVERLETVTTEFLKELGYINCRSATPAGQLQ